MLKLKRKAKPQEKEWEFDNPSAQYGDSNDDSDDAVSPRSGSSSTRSKADSDQDGDTVSPRSGSKADSDRDDDMASPRSGSDTPRSPGDLDIDLDLNERVFKRNKTNYTVFLTVMILLIPVYGLFALLMGWAWWVLPNPISAMATIVTAVLPWVLWLGVKGAYRQSLARLQLFSFMMLLAISLQLSLALTMILDDGTLSDAYISGVTVAFSALCEETAALPVGADMLPINAVCECLKHDDAAAGNISMAMVTSHPDVVQCSRAVLERDLALDGRHLMVFAVVTLLVEVGLAWMAYHMMEDLDVAAAKYAAVWMSLSCSPFLASCAEYLVLIVKQANSRVREMCTIERKLHRRGGITWGR